MAMKRAGLHLQVDAGLSNPKAVREPMPPLFDRHLDKCHPIVRMSLGDVFFVFRYRHVDGNGRIGWFLRDLILLAGE